MVTQTVSSSSSASISPSISPSTSPPPSFAPFPPSLLSADERKKALRFAATFLWADLEVAVAERAFLHDLARELRIDDAERAVDDLLEQPPTPEDIDPTEVRSRETADVIRGIALRAIAADGVVAEEEMRMFELLDDLLPRPPT